MFATGSNQSQKLVKMHTNPSEIETRSTVLRSTLSSRAKQATCRKAPVASSSINITSNRGVSKAKGSEPMLLLGKPMISVGDHNALNKKNVRSLKASRNSSSTDTVTSRTSTLARKEFKKDLDNKNKFAPVSNGPKNLPPILRSSNRSRTPNTARTSTNAKESDSLRSRLWQRNKTCSTLMLSKNPYDASREISENQEIPPQQPIEIGVQTNEKEILNHSLLVGDIKFLKPSQATVDQIEKQRKDLKTKQLLKAQRKFEKHSERQEEHLNDLKEFLEKSYVTKKARKTRDTTEEEQNSMDQLFNRDLPKTESITDIKARIKRKEQELLNLFDNVETCRLAGKSN